MAEEKNVVWEFTQKRGVNLHNVLDWIEISCDRAAKFAMRPEPKTISAEIMTEVNNIRALLGEAEESFRTGETIEESLEKIKAKARTAVSDNDLRNFHEQYALICHHADTARHLLFQIK